MEFFSGLSIYEDRKGYSPNAFHNELNSIVREAHDPESLFYEIPFKAIISFGYV
jgi:hypothetical protein